MTMIAEEGNKKKDQLIDSLKADVFSLKALQATHEVQQKLKEQELINSFQLQNNQQVNQIKLMEQRVVDLQEEI